MAGRPGRDLVLAARGRQLSRALRAPAPEARGWALRALPARAQLELRQHRLERVPVPPPAPLRPPCPSDPSLPGAAALRGPARAPLRLRLDDPARICDAALVPQDRPDGRRALPG